MFLPNSFHWLMRTAAQMTEVSISIGSMRRNVLLPYSRVTLDLLDNSRRRGKAA